MTRPKAFLSAYPRLHLVLKNDPQANAEFNTAISQMKLSAGGDVSDLSEHVEELRRLLKEEQTVRADAEKTLAKMTRFIMLLGGVIESQMNLQPYAQEVELAATHQIKFNANQIRMAMRLYWDAVADVQEKLIADSIKANDPATDPED